MVNEKSLLESLDKEWLAVLKELVDSGITKEQFKEYLEQMKKAKAPK